MAGNFNQSLATMYSQADTSGMSMPDAINEVTSIMGSMKLWFDDNAIPYSAADLVSSAELVYECMESD